MRARRGLSTIVGMVFAIIALSTTLAYITYSMNTLDQYNQAVLSKNHQSLNQNQEKFQVTSGTFVNNKFNVTVANTGNLPINFTKLWVLNTTAFSASSDTNAVGYYSLTNSFVVPGGTLKNIGQSIPYTFPTTQAYHLKLVTSRGNVQDFNLNSGGSAPLFTQLNVNPTIPPGYNVAVFYTITNNQTSNNILLNVQPQLSILTTGMGSATLVSGPTPAQFSNLQPGGAITFKWIYTIAGTDGDTITFTGSIAPTGSNPASGTLTVQNVQFAATSSTSLQTQGLVCCRTSGNILVLHKETYNTIGGGYQMYSGQADNAVGTTINLQNGITKKVLFYTNYDNMTNVSIKPGNWILSMLYRSVPMPSSLQSNGPDMMFLFNSGQQLLDSTGNSNTMIAGQGSAAPSYSASCTRDGSGCYTFTGSTNQYLSIACSGGCSNIVGSNTAPATAGWFMPTATPVTKGVIFRFEASSAANYWEVALLPTRQLQFTFAPNSGLVVTCTSSATSLVGLNDWNFFVAKRTRNPDGGGVLYINGTQSGSCINTNTEIISSTSNLFIGSAPSSPYNGFTGSIDYIMFWKNYDMSSSQISDLYPKSYGTSAHLVNIKADVLDGKTGNFLKNVFTANNVALPYLDGLGSSSTWKYNNYTAINVQNATDPNGKVQVSGRERLLLNVTWANVPSSVQDMNWRIDDLSLPNNNILASFLQIPTPSTSFVSYFQYRISQPLTVSIVNQGPYGVWITSAGTRTIFVSVTPGVLSAAGVGVTANGTAMGTYPNSNAFADSTYLPLYGKLSVGFTTPNSVPNTDVTQCGCASTNIVPNNNYQMYISIFGYDISGNTVFKSYYIGLVQVLP